MSFIVCPVCGKNSSVNRFNPSSLDLDVYVRSSRGLGRGRGFSWTPLSSILAKGDPDVEAIKDRVLELSRLFIETDVLTQQEVLSFLKIQQVDQGQVQTLTGQLISLKRSLDNKDDVISGLTGRLGKVNQKNSEKADVITDMTNKLNRMRRLIKENSELSEDLSEANIILQNKVSSLEDQIEELTEGGKRLVRIVKRKKRKIEKLESIIEDLGEVTFG